MTGIKLARIRRCNGGELPTCPYHHVSGSWDWPKCFFGREEPMAVALPLARVLDNAAYEGPATNCPAGYWADLKPADIEVEQREQEPRQAAGFIDNYGEFLTRLPDDEILVVLRKMIVGKKLTQRVGELAAQSLGLKL